MIQILKKYFPALSKVQYEQLEALAPLYAEWNEKINVISRKDMDSFYERHVLHSLGIAKIISFKDQTKVLDIGTGGGFPGIPLAILFPNADFHLVDSIGKKIKVVEEIAAELQLKNVRAEKLRAEELMGPYDFVVCRAVTEFSKIVFWMKPKISKKSFNELPNGILCLKGGELNTELVGFEKSTHLIDLKNFFSEEFFETKKIVVYKV